MLGWSFTASQVRGRSSPHSHAATEIPPGVRDVGSEHTLIDRREKKSRGGRNSCQQWQPCTEVTLELDGESHIRLGKQSLGWLKGWY